MNKTSYNNYKNNFLPFLASNLSNSDRTLKNQKLNDTQRKDFSRNKKNYINGTLNNQIQLYKKINSFQSNKLPICFKKNNNYCIRKNFDIKKLNKNFISSLFNINNSTDKTNAFHFNKESINSTDENKNNNTLKNILNFDLNRSDTFKKYNSSYLFQNLLNQVSLEPKKKEAKSTLYKNSLYKFSDFYKKSRDEKVGAKQIYRHYLKNEHQSYTPKNHQHIFNGSYDTYYAKSPKLKILYGDNPSFTHKLYEIKRNDYIAKKKDFKINEYQKVLMKLYEKKISDNNMKKLKKEYLVFNEKNFGIKIPKGRYINLAFKLKDYLSLSAFEHLKKMDKNYPKYFCNDKIKNKKEKDKKKNKDKDKENNIEKKIIIKKIKMKKDKKINYLAMK